MVKTGIHIHPSEHWLGASPDGLVVQGGKVVGLVEVKNPCLRDTLSNAARTKKDFCLQLRNGELHLRKWHKYWWQVVVLMEVLFLPWCDFIVRIDTPHQLFVERVFRDPDIWAKVQPKVQAFWKRAMLPELACPRHQMSPGIREPGNWVGMNRQDALNAWY